jgi:hypothetical protein
VSKGTCATAVSLETIKIGTLIRVPKPQVWSWDRCARTHTRGEPERGEPTTEVVIVRVVLENYEFMHSERTKPVITMSPEGMRQEKFAGGQGDMGRAFLAEAEAVVLYDPISSADSFSR